jgi:hypothetical protein
MGYGDTPPLAPLGLRDPALENAQRLFSVPDMTKIDAVIDSGRTLQASMTCRKSVSSSAKSRRSVPGVCSAGAARNPGQKSQPKAPISLTTITDAEILPVICY